MSHYARLVRELEVWIGVNNGDEARRLEVGTEIRHVTPHEEESTAFEALIGDKWLLCFTPEDLPEFTDRGRARRADEELPIHPALGRGRPPREDELTPRGVRFSNAQWNWITLTAKARAQTVSQYMRAILRRQGMPP